MATELNNFSRKRKSTSDLIFEVDEGDCSPSITPEPQANSELCSVSETEALSQTSTDGSKRFGASQDFDVSKISLPPDEPLENIALPKLTDDLSCVDMDVASPQATIDKPFITLIFRDKDVSNKYKTQIIHYINSVVPMNLNEDSNYGLEINLWENHLNNTNSISIESNDNLFRIDTTPASRTHDKHRFDTTERIVIDSSKSTIDPNYIINDKPSQKIRLNRADKEPCGINTAKNDKFCFNFPHDSQYVIDTTPSKHRDAHRLNRLNHGNTPKNVDAFVVDTTPSHSREILPQYSPNECDVIDVVDLSKLNESDRNAKQFRPQTVCFNCDGNHALRDCKQARDHRRINAARQKYMATAQAKSVRYHLDDEQKYKDMIPGQISDKLRRALNLRKYEIPPYVYRMRLLGYPPGWLQEAMVTNTKKLDVFDFQGCPVQNGVDEITKVIDKSKIIDYPGFNVPLEKGNKDVGSIINNRFLRPTNTLLFMPTHKTIINKDNIENHSKSAMIECVEKLISFAAEATNVPATTSSNVPADEIVESDSNSQQSELHATIGSQSAENVECRSQSPTLTDLELRKHQLLAELEDGSLLNSPVPPENMDKTPKVPTTPPAEMLESPLVVSTAFGTPIIKSASPFASLPNPDKFSKDISQVINFENLPDAIGKYEQMTKVISKVREVVKNNIPTERKHS